MSNSCHTLAKERKILPQENVDYIIDFHKSNESSRQMLGKKDYVRIKHQHDEKCLMLFVLIYINYM